jgi:hypothetical protein
MTHFEFISVAVSIVLALSVARLLSALPHVLTPGRRYWIHALWSVALLFAHLDFWWTIWIYREIDPWTFTGFAVVMLTPALLFLAASSLVSDSPATIESWRTHFYARHRLFFSLYFATVCSIPLRQLIVLGDASFLPHVEGLPALPVASLMLVGLAIPVLGIITTNERAHAFLVLFSATGIFFNIARQ